MAKRWVTVVAMMAAGIAGPVVAQEALILGNEDYDRGADVTRGAAVVDAARVMEDAGSGVVSGRDVTADRQMQLLSEFETAAPGDGARVAVLSGRFVSAGTETWFLPVDAQATSLATLPSEAIPLSSVIAMLAGGSGPALLVLGADGADGDADLGPFVTAGIDAVEPSEGVTIISGAPRDVSGFVRDILAVPDANMADGLRGRGLTVQGDLPNASFLGDGVTVPAPAMPSAEETAWRLARNGDTIAGYVDYLDRYPRGQYATEASSRLEGLRTPTRSQPQITEDNLSLSRDARQAVQRDLTALGFDTNGVDGLFGSGTRRAVTNWQSSVGLPETGYLDGAQIDRLDAAAASVAPAPVPQATPTYDASADAAYWEQTGQGGTVAGARLYLDRYPSGRFADIAQETISSADVAAEREAWTQAERAGTPEAYQIYLQSFPDGQNANSARTRLTNLQPQQQQQVPSTEQQLNDIVTDGINNLLKRD